MYIWIPSSTCGNDSWPWFSNVRKNITKCDTLGRCRFVPTIRSPPEFLSKIRPAPPNSKSKSKYQSLGTIQNQFPKVNNPHARNKDQNRNKNSSNPEARKWRPPMAKSQHTFDVRLRQSIVTFQCRFHDSVKARQDRHLSYDDSREMTKYRKTREEKIDWDWNRNFHLEITIVIYDSCTRHRYSTGFLIPDRTRYGELNRCLILWKCIYVSIFVYICTEVCNVMWCVHEFIIVWDECCVLLRIVMYGTR